MISYEVTAFGEPLTRTDRPTPAPAGGQVLLRVLAAGVCHTDIHTWEGSYDLGGDKRLRMEQRGVALPLTLGHETVGEVVAAGPDARGARPGQRFLVYPWIGCGDCKVCRRGRENLCAAPRFLGIFRPGGYSDHIMVPDARYLVGIGDLGPEQAAPYACSGLTTYSAIRKIPPEVLAEEAVVVIGAGGLGLMCVTLLRAMGCSNVVVLEPDGARRGAALAAGAHAVVDANAAAALDEARRAAGEVWAVIDCVGAARTVQQGMDLLTKGGQLILVGLFGGELSLSPALVPMRAISIEGSYIGNLEELHALMALVRERRPRAIPTACRCLEDAQSALADLAAGRVVGRLLLSPSPATLAQATQP
ncbi:alcohol dehydrogenase [Achromobacter sp. NPDC058515]|uniref:alcohol dehydrogenase n=1 Tax=Achromobacter sp. NPDC058515 TaxID=3346533 RepID=UPI003652EB80